MKEDEISDAVKTLYEFSRIMNEWEINTKKEWDKYRYRAEKDELYDPNDVIRENSWKKWMGEYIKIHNMYCVPTAEIRGHHLSVPPSYDPINLQITSIREIARNEIVLMTCYRDYPLMDMAYKMRKEIDGWKIVNRFYIAPDETLLKNSI